MTSLGVLERRDEGFLVGADPLQLLVGGGRGVASRPSSCSAASAFAENDTARELRLDLRARRCKLARERFALARRILQLVLGSFASALDLSELALERFDLGV